MKMVFKELYLYSPHEKVAKRIVFADGINIITSSQVDGNEKGKSVILRSLYHALGAESLFAAKWDTKNKIFILKFAIDSVEFYIYRSSDLYKLFDSEKKLLFVATKSRELAEKLKNITGFAVMLPSRHNDKLEITPPVYNYLPFFLDQDHYEGSRFASFDRLAQYVDYKDNVLFYHFGVYDEEYFSLVRQREEYEEQIAEIGKRIEMLQEMLLDIDRKLEVGSYSGDIDSLNLDVERYRKEYSQVVEKLNKSKMKLVELRNNLYDLEALLKETEVFEDNNEKEIRKLRRHICPECGSEITDTVELKSKRYNISDDIIIVKNDIQISIHKLLDDIAREEAKYAKLLSELDAYQEKLKINTKQVSDILRHKGLCEIRDSIVQEKHDTQDSLDTQQSELDVVNKGIKSYNERKKAITDRYYELLMSAKTKFGIDEIDPDKFKKLSTNFSASGSNKYIATVIWYFTIIRIRNEFNPSAIQFPIVLDSPNNVETDDEKASSLLKYLLANSELSSQFIMSGIGFDTEDFKKMTEKKMNIISLTNEKYHLLQEEDYNQYSYLMNEFCDAE